MSMQRLLCGCSLHLYSQSPDLETIQMSINWGVNKQNVVYLKNAYLVIKKQVSYWQTQQGGGVSKFFSQFSSVAQLCLILCSSMDCSTPGLPVHHQLPEFTQTHVHWVGDAIQLSHPLSSPSLPNFNLSQNQGLFKWVTTSQQVAKYWSFSISPSNEYSGHWVPNNHESLLICLALNFF